MWELFALGMNIGNSVKHELQGEKSRI
jgi:hypothetical protein